jgi:hypothetical protein
MITGFSIEEDDWIKTLDYSINQVASGKGLRVNEIEMHSDSSSNPHEKIDRERIDDLQDTDISFECGGKHNFLEFAGSRHKF